MAQTDDAIGAEIPQQRSGEAWTTGPDNSDEANDESGAAPYTADVPRFSEQATSAGIDHVYDGPWEHFVGGGVASFDCNGDRLPDLYLAGGKRPAALYVNESVPGGKLQFRRQPVADADLDAVTGAYPLDIDNDGHRDLVVLRVGENRLLKGGPDCAFSAANARFEFDGGSAWTTAFSATFESGARWPTLAFGNYVDRTAPGSPWGTCHDNVLHRAADDRQPRQRGEPSSLSKPSNTDTNTDKTPQYDDALPLMPGHCALSMLFTDWNRSGSDALRITNDRQYHRGGEEQMWQLDNGRYPRLFSRSDGWASVVIWGMGIAEGDLDADGFPEYALTSMGDTRLQSLDIVQAMEEGRPAYEDIAWSLGVTAHRPYTGDDLKPSTGWHAGFADFNNDSRLDLYISKGNVENMSDFAAYDPDNLLLRREDGTFSEQGARAGLALPRRGRGAAVTDLNADGLLDLVVVNRAEPVSLFRNHGPSGQAGQATKAVHAGQAAKAGRAKQAAEADPPDRPTSAPGGNWLQIELQQLGANRDAIGARLSILTGDKTQTRRLQSGGGHASGDNGFTHIGLGVAERATVRVQWPDGEWSAPYRLFADNFAILTRGEDHVRYWYPH